MREILYSRQINSKHWERFQWTRYIQLHWEERRRQRNAATNDFPFPLKSSLRVCRRKTPHPTPFIYRGGRRERGGWRSERSNEEGPRGMNEHGWKNERQRERSKEMRRQRRTKNDRGKGGKTGGENRLMREIRWCFGISLSRIFFPFFFFFFSLSFFFSTRVSRLISRLLNYSSIFISLWVIFERDRDRLYVISNIYFLAFHYVNYTLVSLALISSQPRRSED